jgi:hypothetical protein
MCTCTSAIWVHPTVSYTCTRWILILFPIFFLSTVDNFAGIGGRSLRTSRHFWLFIQPRHIAAISQATWHPAELPYGRCARSLSHLQTWTHLGLSSSENRWCWETVNFSGAVFFLNLRAERLLTAWKAGWFVGWKVQGGVLVTKCVAPAASLCMAEPT